MARIRTIKPEFWSDEKLSPLPDSERLLFLGLLSMADDLGRLVDSPKAIEAFIWPFADRSRETTAGLATLARLGRITRGTTASGQAIIQVTNWPRHQRVDKPSLKSCLPQIVAAQCVDTAPGSVAEDSREGGATVAEVPRSDLDLRPTTYDQRAATSAKAAAADPALPAVDVYRVQLTRAANEAITAKWGEQPTPLRAGSGYALELARDVQAAGVPLWLATTEIRVAIERRPPSEGPPRAMTYFRQRILEAWATAKDEGRVSAPVMPAMSPEELWRLVLLTGLHRLDFAAREAAIQQAVAHGAIPEEAAFREAWGMVHVAAHRIVTTAKDSAQIVAEFRALLAKGQQQPMPKHMADLPHPYQGERPVNVEVAA